MHVWKVCIRPDPEAPDLAQGYALAASEEDAFAIVDHPDADVFPAHPADYWLGDFAQRVVWVTRPLPCAYVRGRS